MTYIHAHTEAKGSLIFVMMVMKSASGFYLFVRYPGTRTFIERSSYTRGFIANFSEPEYFPIRKENLTELPRVVRRSGRIC
jgi:hypothetical protein